jgi:hypothetical protein
MGMPRGLYYAPDTHFDATPYASRMDVEPDLLLGAFTTTTDPRYAEYFYDGRSSLGEEE